MTDKDPLGYDAYARTLWARIQAALHKDQGTNAQGQAKDLGDDPLVVGIFGEWGAGKSHLLQLIYKLAQQHAAQLANVRSADSVGVQKDEEFEICIPVFFQPWKYEHEKHLHVPLLMHIIDAYAELAQKALTSDEQGDKLVHAYYEKAKPWLGLAWRRVLRPAAEATAGKFALPIKLSPEIEDMARAITGLAQSVKDERDRNAAVPLNASDGGHYFYRWHRVLQQLSQPWRFPELLKSETGEAICIQGKPRINFVIFIDDLDRCLPEKAVQTLELIKTVFNVESFAFVLALDDEVIERGIGHRYKEYKLQDKKPEMPITGFEYLEKIVHLPFRLPGLTPAQARRFLVQYEENTAVQGQPLWFSVADVPKDEPQSSGVQLANDPLNAPLADAAQKNMSYGQRSGSPGSALAHQPSELLDLVMASFDAYVPRKLIRIAELMRQVMHVVQQEHGKTVTANGTAPDIRVILALLLLQLFQPELYRLARRRVDVFPALYGGFARQELTSPSSDIDLWKWVDAFGKTTPATTGQSQVVDALNPYEAAVQRIADIAQTTEKADAQYVRLPLVQQLVEHRAVQRHVFNVLGMVKELVRLLDLSSSRNLGDFKVYLSLLSANEAPAQTALPPDKRARFVVGDVQRLLADITSYRAEVYENLATRHDWPEQKVMDAPSANDLAAKLTAWTQNGPDAQASGQTSTAAPTAAAAEPPTVDAEATNGPADTLAPAQLATRQERQMHLLQVFKYLAPYIAQDDGDKFWALVSNVGKDWLPDPNKPNTLTPDPANASLYLDVQSMLGQDDRFDRAEVTHNGKTFKPLYLLKDRWNGNGPKEEPIPGFVRVPAGGYDVGDPKIDRENPTARYTLDHDIYMGRTPVTVDQFGAFVADGGYGGSVNDVRAKTFWDEQGWAWRHSTADFVRDTPKDKNLREWLERRSGELRAQPMDWAEQQRVGSRAVHGVTWFEARAYARWLAAQWGVRGVLNGELAGYGVSLPNEWQWEIAARSHEPMSTNLIRWPWGNEEADAGRRANIHASKIGHASVSGCFAPNAAGLLDLAGNVWEWQCGLFCNAGPVGNDDQRRLRATGRSDRHCLPQEFVHVLTDDSDTSDLVVVRGGSWSFGTLPAACSFCYWNRADFWLKHLGFRVMLSLAKTKTET